MNRNKIHRLSRDRKNRTVCGRDASDVLYLAMTSWEGVDCKECIKKKSKVSAFEWKDGE